MNIMWIVVGGIFVVLILLALWIIATYNRLVRERLKVKTQWHQIDVILQQRLDLIPSLLETVKGYMAHEKSTLQAVTDARTRYIGATNDQSAQIQAENALSAALGRLMAVSENYPELKADRSFLNLQQQIGAIESKLADFRQFYNDMVLRYNQQLVTIPSNLIAGWFNFQEASFYQVEEAAKTKPEIKF